MAIHVYNTLTRQKEPLVTREPGKVSMYACGPTPYDYPHLGNARSAVAFDIVHRYLEYRGFQVIYVNNITDIEDKIIKRSAEQGIPWDMLVERFVAIFFEEMEALNVKRATVYPRATENIEEIVNLVQALIDRGYAYVVDGDVYFEVRKFESYGQLSSRNVDELESGARVEVNEIKRDPLDFALWKSSKPGEPSWDSPWGPGRPGWHIECSAMSLKFLGQGFDIHGGGQDLIFPHHENEIAQSEGAMGLKSFAHYWLHNGFVTINREKMSKSLGNFFTVREIIERYPAPVVRYFLTASHYRSPIDFSDQALDQSAAAYKNMALWAGNMQRIIEATLQPGEPDPERSERLRALLAGAEDDFRAAMDDDFNTPQALAALNEVIREANRLASPAAPAGPPDLHALTALSDARALVLRLAGVLGITLLAEEKTEDTLAPRLMQLLIDLRAQARKDKNFPLADAIRNGLTEIGVLLEDTPQGTVWRRK
jgi:cysteinyl-tRNA synthetase